MRCRGERGSSVVEFVLMTTLLLFLLFGVMQVGLYVYARNVAAAAAADGARTAAARGMPADSGARRADELLHSALHGGASAIDCSAGFDVDNGSGLEVATVRCTGRLHSVFAPLGSWLTVDVSGSALRERQP